MPKSTSKTENNELQQLQAENAALREEIDQLKDEMMRLISRNLDLSERLEDDVDLRRRVEVARELLEGNIERQRNADLQDDGQLMALIEMRVESDMLHQDPDFDTAALARLLGVRQERQRQVSISLSSADPSSAISTTYVCCQPCACSASSLITR